MRHDFLFLEIIFSFVSFFHMYFLNACGSSFMFVRIDHLVIHQNKFSFCVFSRRARIVFSRFIDCLILDPMA